MTPSAGSGTPRTDAAIKRAAYKVDDDMQGSRTEYDIGKLREDMGKLERELSQSHLRAEAVREACARVCDAMIVDWRARCAEGSEQMGYEDHVLNEAANAIRALKDKPGGETKA